MSTITSPSSAHESTHESTSSTQSSSTSNSSEKLVQFLGWFSIALGVAELVAPQTMAKLTGLKHSSIFPVYGLREIACGIGILATNKPGGWLWARVAGDAMDLATLAADNKQRTPALIAAAAVAGVTLLDVLSAQEQSK